MDAARRGIFDHDQRKEDVAATVDLNNWKLETLPTDEDKREDTVETGETVAIEATAKEEVHIVVVATIEDEVATDHSHTIAQIFEPLAEIAVDHGVANTSGQGIRRKHDTARRPDQLMQRQESSAITVDEHLIGIVCS